MRKPEVVNRLIFSIIDISRHQASGVLVPDAHSFPGCISGSSKSQSVLDVHYVMTRGELIRVEADRVHAGCECFDLLNVISDQHRGTYDRGDCERRLKGCGDQQPCLQSDATGFPVEMDVAERYGSQIRVVESGILVQDPCREPLARLWLDKEGDSRLPLETHDSRCIRAKHGLLIIWDCTGCWSWRRELMSACRTGGKFPMSTCRVPVVEQTMPRSATGSVYADALIIDQTFTWDREHDRPWTVPSGCPQG